VTAPQSPAEADAITAEFHGEKATLILRRFLRHRPETVWRALTDPDQIRQWYLTTATSDGRAGGSVEWTTEMVGVRANGTILAWDPPRVYEYEWNIQESGVPLFRGLRTVVRWELTATPGGTMLVLTHRNLTKAVATGFQTGLPFLLDRLEALLDQRPLPTDWVDRVREGGRQASYSEPSTRSGSA
jgi:uncharacterized protein YndB with AHSA1/START domain